MHLSILKTICWATLLSILCYDDFVRGQMPPNNRPPNVQMQQQNRVQKGPPQQQRPQNPPGAPPQQQQRPQMPNPQARPPMRPPNAMPQGPPPGQAPQQQQQPPQQQQQPPQQPQGIPRFPNLFPPQQGQQQNGQRLPALPQTPDEQQDNDNNAFNPEQMEPFPPPITNEDPADMQQIENEGMAVADELSESEKKIETKIEQHFGGFLETLVEEEEAREEINGIQMNNLNPYYLRNRNSASGLKALWWKLIFLSMVPVYYGLRYT